MQSIRELVSSLVTLVTNILSSLTINDTYYFTRDTGTGNINKNITNPGIGSWEIVEIRLHLVEDVGGSSTNFVVDINSSVDSVYNVNLITHDMEESKDFRDNNFDCVLESNDVVNITWNNSNNRTYGLLVVSRKKV